MRDYGKIHSSFWTSPTIRALSDDGRTLAAYLLTSPHSNMLGCFRIPPAYVAEDLGWVSGRVSEGFAELFREGFATLDEGSKWLVIHRFMKWNPLENPNVGKAAEKLFDQIPDSSPAKALLAGFLKEFGKHFPTEKLDRFETLSKPYRNPEPEPEPEPEPFPEPEPEPKPEPNPLQAAKKSAAAPETGEVWSAYAEAYEARYRATPVRNAKVNGQIAQLLKRIGKDEAPAVARWYVASQNRFYVQKRHSVDCLLADCEGLRTEWATNTRVTETRAREADRLQTNGDMWGRLIEQAHVGKANGGH